jgi:hypothetical protein
MRRVTTTILAAALAALTGCAGGSGPRPTGVPVTGKVLLNKEPLAGALLTFIPDTPGGDGGSARTGPDGSYTVIRPQGAGLPAGSYRVVINRRVMPDGSPVAEGTSPNAPGVKETLPPIYSNFAKASLSATVKEGVPATFDYALIAPGIH